MPADTILTTFTQKKILYHLGLNTPYSPPAQCYVGIASSTATDAELHAGTLTNEITTYTGNRPAINFNAAAPNANGYRITSTAESAFPGMPAATVRYAIICDSTTKGAGNILAVCRLSSDVTTVAGATLRLIGGLTIIELDKNSVALTGAGCQMSSYAQEKMLNLIFRNVAYVSPTAYAGLADDTATAADMEAGDLTNEIDAYTGNRPLCGFVDAGAIGDTWSLANGPPATIEFPAMPAVNVLWVFVIDSTTKGAGNILYWIAMGGVSAPTPVAVGAGDTATSILNIYQG